MNTIFIKKNLKKCVIKSMRAIYPRKICVGPLRILMYHSIGGTPHDHRLAVRVKQDNFMQQLRIVSDLGYKTFSVSSAIQKLSCLNEKIIAFTFDDGYKDNFECAAPLLAQAGLIATFFITVGLVEGRIKKIWSDSKAREYMNWEDIAALSLAGHEIGSHMLEHVDLRNLKKDELIKELKVSKEAIEDKIKKPVSILSYPYGGVNKKVIELARDVGYIGACSSLRGTNSAGCDAFLLKRTEINGFDTISDFCDKLSGIYDFSFMK